MIEHGDRRGHHGHDREQPRQREACGQNGNGDLGSWRCGRPSLRKHGGSLRRERRRGHPRDERWLIDKGRRRKNGSGRGLIIEIMRGNRTDGCWPIFRGERWLIDRRRRRKNGSGRGLILEIMRGNRTDGCWPIFRGERWLIDRRRRRKNGSGRGPIIKNMRGNRRDGCWRILNRRVGRRRCGLGAEGGGGARGGGRRRRSRRRIHPALCAIRKNQAEHRERGRA